MSLTFLQLQDKVIEWLHETDDDDTIRPNVKEAIANANAARASEKDWSFMLAAPTTTALVPGTRTVSLAADFDKPLYFYNRTERTPLNIGGPNNLDVYNAPWNTTSQSSDGTLEGRVLRLAYTPNSADVIEYQYYRQPTELSADGDLPDIPYPYSRILIYDALLVIGAISDDISQAKMKLWEGERTKYEYSLLAFSLENNVRESPQQFVKYTNDLAQPRGIVNAD